MKRLTRGKCQIIFSSRHFLRWFNTVFLRKNRSLNSDIFLEPCLNQILPNLFVTIKIDRWQAEIKGRINSRFRNDHLSYQSLGFSNCGGVSFGPRDLNKADHFEQKTKLQYKEVGTQNTWDLHTLSRQSPFSQRIWNIHVKCRNWH